MGDKTLSNLATLLKEGGFFSRLKAVKELSKIKNEQAVKLLKQATKDTNFFVRWRAKKKLQTIQPLEKTSPQQHVQTIEEPMQIEKTWDQRRDDLLELAKKDSKNIDEILRYLDDSSPAVRWHAANVLKDIDTEQYHKALFYLSKDPNIQLRHKVLKELVPILKSAPETEKIEKRYCPICEKRVKPEKFSLPDYKYLDSEYHYHLCPHCYYRFT